MVYRLLIFVFTLIFIKFMLTNGEKCGIIVGRLKETCMSLTFDYITQEDIKLPQHIQDLMTVEYLSTFRDRLDIEFKCSTLKKTYWGFYQEIEDYGGFYNVLYDLNEEWINKGGKEIFEWLCSFKDFFEWECMLSEITRLMVVKGVIEKGTIDDCMIWYSEGKEI